MAIEGHKERALLRRGYHIQEALKRRVIPTVASIRRNLITEDSGGEEQLKLSQLCGQETSQGIANSIYCKLSTLLDELPTDLAEETYKAIVNLYNFFKPIKKDNRVIFKKTIEVILKNENPQNSLILISRFLNDKDFSEDDVKKALIQFRNIESDKVLFSGNSLEDFLRQARYKEYSKYEESFKGDNFELLRGMSRLSHGQINPETGKPETFFKLVKSVYDKKVDINFLINAVTEGVLKTDVEDLLYKSDLKVTNDLKVGDKIILPKDSNVEVKKMDYEVDSYFSEYFAIYKKSDLPDLAYQKDFVELYNKIINGVFEKVSEKGEFMTKKISDNIDAIIFDKNLIVLKNDLEFYWSNKGQRSCDELRLSIRFRIKNPEITTYIYDSGSHSNELVPKELSISVKPRTYC